MKKICKKSLLVSRADKREAISQQFERHDTLDPDGQETVPVLTEKIENCIFLQNRFYREAAIYPLVEAFENGIAGEQGLQLSVQLKNEMTIKNQCIRGDALWRLLKNALGMECAALLIGEAGQLRGIGLYSDRILARFKTNQPVDNRELPEKKLRNSIHGKDEKNDEIQSACRGCRDHSLGRKGTLSRWKTK